MSGATCVGNLRLRAPWGRFKGASSRQDRSGGSGVGGWSGNHRLLISKNASETGSKIEKKVSPFRRISGGFPEHSEGLTEVIRSRFLLARPRPRRCERRSHGLWKLRPLVLRGGLSGLGSSGVSRRLEGAGYRPRTIVKLFTFPMGLVTIAGCRRGGETRPTLAESTRVLATWTSESFRGRRRTSWNPCISFI